MQWHPNVQSVSAACKRRGEKEVRRKKGNAQDDADRPNVDLKRVTSLLIEQDLRGDVVGSTANRPVDEKTGQYAVFASALPPS